MKHYKTALILLIVVILAYFPSLSGVWQYDDLPVIVNNPAFKISSYSQILDFGLMRFLPTTSFALNSYFGGTELFGFHLVNLIIHLLNTLLVFLMTAELLAALNKKEFTAFSRNTIIYICLLTSAFWALAPINTQAVTYIVQRIASIAAFFYFTGYLFYLKYRNSQTVAVKQKALYLLIAVISAFCAFISKENTLILPFMILTTEWLIYQKSSPVFFKRAVLAMTILGTAVFVYLLFFMNSGVEGLNLSSLLNNSYPHRDFTPLERLLVEPRILVYHLTQIIFPFVGRFHLNYDFDWLNAPYQIWTYFSILIILVALVIAIIIRKKQPLISVCIFFFFINHLAESTIVGLHLVFEHRNYTPSWSICLLLALLLVYLAQKNRYFILISLLFIAFSTLNTFLLNLKYQNSYCNAGYDFSTQYTANSFDGASLYLDKLYFENGDYISVDKILKNEYFIMQNHPRRSKYLQQYLSATTRTLGLIYLNRTLSAKSAQPAVDEAALQINNKSGCYDKDNLTVLKHIYVSSLLLKYGKIAIDDYIYLVFKSDFQRAYYPASQQQKFYQFIASNIKVLSSFTIEQPEKDMLVKITAELTPEIN